MSKSDDLVIRFAQLMEYLRRVNVTLRTRCANRIDFDSETGEYAPSCLSTFFEEVKEYRFGGDVQIGFDQARTEVLADTELCEVCKAKLAALDSRRELKPKIGVVKRHITVHGKRLMKAQEATNAH